MPADRLCAEWSALGGAVCFISSIIIIIVFFFFNDTATTEIYTLSLHDALPICCIRIIVEFERQPLQKPLTQFICHLMWQLNSPLIEGIHLLDRKSTRLNSSH